MKLSGLHHVAICVDDLDRALAFYTGVLGLEQIDRPPLPNDGAWLIVDGNEDQMVHLMITGDAPPATFQHFALACPDLDGAAVELAEHGYTLSPPEDIPGYGRQAFVRDPEGNLIELNEKR